MYPVIIDFGIVDIFGFQFQLAIYSFGLMLVVAFYSCYFFLDRDLKDMGYDEKLASDIIFWSAVGGIVGSKVYHIIENLDQIMASQRPLAHIFSGSGLVFLGGLIGAIIAVTVVLKKYNVPWLKFADIIAPLILLGYAIGRIGCLLVGDDYGIPSDLPWAMAFPNGLPPTNVAVHPTQVYETLICGSLFYYLWSRRNDPKVTGSYFFKYLIIAGIERFFIEFIRTNEKYLFDSLSGAQIISIFMISIGIYFLMNPLTKSVSDTS